MIVAGCDLSYTRSAIVWMDEGFVVQKSSAFAIAPGPFRLKRALYAFNRILTSANDLPPPSLCVIEDNAYGAPSRVVVVKLAALNTLLKVVCECWDVDWLEVSPSALKKGITGKGNAEKAQVAQELLRLYGIKFDNDKGFDLSDAAAAAVWGVKHRLEGK